MDSRSEVLAETEEKAKSQTTWLTMAGPALGPWALGNGLHAKYWGLLSKVV